MNSVERECVMFARCVPFKFRYGYFLSFGRKEKIDNLFDDMDPRPHTSPKHTLTFTGKRGFRSFGENQTFHAYIRNTAQTVHPVQNIVR